MERFFGFDLGDAESAVCVLPKEGAKEPQMLTIREAQSFITAYARLLDQELIIGEGACYHPGATERKLRFKSHFLTDRESEADIRCFAAGVLGELYKNGDLVQGEDCCFYVGCPAGWDKNTRERYRRIFEKVGYPPARIISESRAALVSACQSKHLQIGLDILSKAQFRSALMKYTAEDSTIVISTHQVRDLENIIDPIIILDRRDVLLNATIEQISEKLFFDYGTTLHPDALYSEQLPGGFIQVLPNTEKADSKVNIEALFNTVHKHKELVKNIFSHE